MTEYTSKLCKRCNTIKPLTEEFWRWNTRKDRRHNWHFCCRACTADKKRIYDNGYRCPKLTPEERFWAKVKLPDLIGTDECWEWQGKIDKRSVDGGYGQFGVNGKTAIAHRFAFELCIGVIPASMLVCHSCDNRKCVNPAHLWLGTNKDNVDDMMAKGRHR